MDSPVTWIFSGVGITIALGVYYGGGLFFAPYEALCLIEF